MTLNQALRPALFSLMALIPLTLACGDKDGDSGTGDGGATDGGSSDGGAGDGGSDGGTDGGAGDGGSDGGADGGADGGSGDGGTGVSFTVEGVVLDMGNRRPTGEGLCAYALDPTAPLGGSGAIDPATDIKGVGVVGAKGVYSIADVQMESLVGMFVLVMDCEGETPTVLPSATGIPVEAYSDLADGAVLEQNALLVSGSYMATIESSLVTAGGTGDLSVDGAMMGFVRNATGAPVSGATVTCDECPRTWYFDNNLKDAGLFATNVSGANRSTSTSGAFMIVGAPVKTYSVSHAGGKLTWDSQLFGTLPGLATFITFEAN